MSPIPTPHSPQHGRILSVRHSVFAVLGLCFVTVMVAIDQTVVGTALPTVVAELNGFKLYAWVATAYLLASVVTVPVFGRLGDFYGRKPFVVASILVFVSGSILCGLADSMLHLVLARAVQGIGAGMVLGTAFACIPDLFPDPHVRLRWQILFSAAFGIASGLGPTVGGLVTQYAGWRAVFFVNIPLSVAGLVLILRYLPWMRHRTDSRIRLDWQGALLIALGFGCLQLFVELLPRHGLSALVTVLAVVCLGSLATLLWWEKRCPEPLIPLSMLRDRRIGQLFVLSVFAGCLLFVLLFYVPLMLQGGFGMSPREAGLTITPLVVCITLGSILNGRVVTRLRQPVLMLYAGFILLALCIAGFVMTSRNTPGALMALYLVLGGLGLGIVLPNLTVFGQQAAGQTLLGIVTAMLQSTRMIGGMLGTALVGTLVTHFYVQGLHNSYPDAGQQPWGDALRDPQLLVNPIVQNEFVARLSALGLDGRVLIEGARAALVDALHWGLVAALMVAAVAALWVVRVPAVDLNSPAPSRGSQDGNGA